jgi:hypothetical protein
MLLRAAAILLFAQCTHAFSARAGARPAQGRRGSSLSIVASISVTRPSAKQLSDLGLQGNIENVWLPTEVSAGAVLSETLQQDVTRYVSSGSGTVCVAGTDESAIKVDEGTLLTVDKGPVELRWTAGAGGELVLLISEYWSPARVAARAVIPAVWAALAVAAVIVFASEML